MIACRARAIVCLLHIYFEDPKLKRAEELFASLLNLPEESASEEKLIGQNVMICTYFEHGKPLKAYDLCLKLTGDKDPQDCSLLLISSSLLTGIESLLRADCLKEVTKLFSVLASVKSPLVNLQKSRAAIAVLANLQRFDNILDWQIICQNIAQISDLPESLQPGFLKVLDNLITSLTKSQKLDFLELLDNELALWDLGQISHIRNLRAQIWLSLCEYFLAKGMEQKALLTAEKIRLLAEDPKFLPLKSKMELVLFKHYTANNDPQKNALFQSLKAPSKEQTAVLCLSQALIIRESEAAFTAPLEKLLALFSEQQTLTQKSYNFDKSTLLSQKLTMTVLLTALSLHNQDLCLAQAMGNDLITPQGWAKWPILAQKYSLMLADFLIDNDIQPNNLEIISQLAKINTPASMTAQGQIYLKLIKKLVSDHKLPQAAALVGQLAELCRQKPLIAVYAQGILAVIEGYVRAGLFLPKLKLSRPVRPTRHPLGSDSSQSGEAPAQDNALFWLMELLALPQKELTAVPCRKAVYSVVIGLIKNFQTTKALEIFALLPAPGEGSAYEEIKIYLNTFLYILNALSLKAVSATFDLVSGLLQSRLLNFVLKYYSSELTDILRILQNIDPQKCRLLAIIPEKFQPDRRQ
jgi:hypothetical protein